MEWGDPGVWGDAGIPVRGLGEDPGGFGGSGREGTEVSRGPRRLVGGHPGIWVGGSEGTQGDPGVQTGLGTQVGLGTPASSPLPGEPWHPAAPLPPLLRRRRAPATSSKSCRCASPTASRASAASPSSSAATPPSSTWCVLGMGDTRVSWEDPGVREGTLTSGGDPGVRGGDARIRMLMLCRPPPQHELYIRAFQKLSEFPPVSVTRVPASPRPRVTPTCVTRVPASPCPHVTLPSSSSPPEADPEMSPLLACGRRGAATAPRRHPSPSSPPPGVPPHVPRSRRRVTRRATARCCGSCWRTTRTW